MRFLLGVLTFLFFIATARAETVYIKYDPSCVDRLNYYFDLGSIDFDRITYKVRKEGNSALFLEVGKESTNILNSVPGRVLTCSEIAAWNETTAERINSGNMRLFIVRNVDGGFNVSPVNYCSVLKQENQQVAYKHPDFDFNTNLADFNYNTPVSSSNSGSVVELERFAYFECTRLLTFKILPNNPKLDPKRILFVPEYGIVEYQNSVTAEKVRGIKLATINDEAYGDVLSDFCNSRSTVTDGTLVNSESSSNNSYSIPDVPANVEYENVPSNDYSASTNYVDSYSNQPVINNPISNFSPATVAPAPTPAPSNPCGVTPETGYHIIMQGETLYGVSRKYGISVNDLRTWNDLHSTDLIKPCNSLKVAAYTAAPINNTPATAPASNQPAEVELVTRGMDRTDMLWLSNAKKHFVLRNETVASLAKRYGYTEERFRYMNGLKENDVLYYGQQVVTSDCNCVDVVQPYSNESTAIFSNKGAAAESVPQDYNNLSFVPITTQSKDDFQSGRLTHTVKSGETLYSISTKYDVAIEQLMNWNNLEKNEILVPLQKLFVE